MPSNFSYVEFQKQLESMLPSSSGETRKVWVNTIIKEDIDLMKIADLLGAEQKIASRFRWLLSEIGLEKPTKLFLALPPLLELSDQLDPAYKTSFANWWLIAGVPIENEAKAIDLCFQWLLSPKENVTIKSRSLLVLFKLTKKYPELKNELKHCLEDQMNKYSKDFEKRARKIMSELD